MKAERTIQDEFRRLRSLRRNPAVQGEEDARLLGAEAALEWVLGYGAPPVWLVSAKPLQRHASRQAADIP